MQGKLVDCGVAEAYYGYYADERIYTCASGGAASAFAEAIIKRKGVVYGVAFSEDFKAAEYVRVTRLEEIPRLRGSKYIASSKMMRMEDGSKQSVYVRVEQDLLDDSLVLFSGLGCDVGALLTYLNRTDGVAQTEKLYTLDLICHGATFSEVQRQFVESLEEKENARITDFTLRGKRNSWQPYILQAVFQNGTKYEEEFYNTDYGYAFNQYCRPQCYLCSYRGKHHRADITIGDYYGLTPKMREYNSLGTSLIFLNQGGKGYKLVEMLDGEPFILGKTDMDFALQHNPNYSRNIKKPKYWVKFDRLFKAYGLHRTAHRVHHCVWRIKRCRIVKNCKVIIKNFLRSLRTS